MKRARNDCRLIEIRDQIGDGVADPARDRHEPANETAQVGRATARDLAVVGQGFREAVSAAAKVMLGGGLVLATGIMNGNAG